jgi:hypothetical protein
MLALGEHPACGRKEAILILGGFLRNRSKITNSIKRKLKEMAASAECNIVCDILMKERSSILFYDVDVLGRISNHHMPLMVRAIMVTSRYVKY